MIFNETISVQGKGSVRKGLMAVLGGGLLLAASTAAVAEGRPAGPMAQSKAPFMAWQQGFEHDTAGWYGAETEGPHGWCGFIEQVSARGPVEVEPQPSAGSSYATVSSGPCNEFWTFFFGIPAGAPYAPGPDLALYSSAWPQSGYVTELDIYLDPEWAGNYIGNFGFQGSGSSAFAVVQLAATVFPTDPDDDPSHTGPHYFVEVVADPADTALSVAGARIEEAGWYTFRYVFSDVAGDVWVDFELAERNGPTLAVVENVTPFELEGPFKLPFVGPFEGELPTEAYGSGHIWFFDIAMGLQVAIDEHRVRRGR